MWLNAIENCKSKVSIRNIIGGHDIFRPFKEKDNKQNPNQYSVLVKIYNGWKLEWKVT